ncbi:MAG: adenosylcobinamide-GDP ribazoletransferase [Solirubrobacterales bacterium]
MTIIPIRWSGVQNGKLGPASVWFPLVGALVGLIAGAARAAAYQTFGANTASVFAVITLVIVTGALHQDGLADCADGLGVRHDRDRRMEVMRDSAIGVFGCLALIGWALLFITILGQLNARDGFALLVAAGALARWAASVHATTTPPARTDGLGTLFDVTALQSMIGGVIAIVIAVAALGLPIGLGCSLAGGFVAGLSSVAARLAIGGRTGDTIGATVAITEIAVCAVALALL